MFLEQFAPHPLNQTYGISNLPLLYSQTNAMGDDGGHDLENSTQ